jgi:hypothetical protein
MKLRQRYTGREFEVRDTEELMRVCGPYYTDEAAPMLCGVLARIIDHLELTPQQKLDIVDPYSDLEIEE